MRSTVVETITEGMVVKLSVLVICLIAALPVYAKKPVMINKPYVLDYKKGCTVTVYQTVDQAEKEGDIEEVCIIDGTSSMSFNHTPETAVKKHANKACDCGVDKVYVASRSKMGVGVATVSMVGFEWVTQAKSQPSVERATQSRSVNERRRDECLFIKSITKGAGGSGDVSKHLEKAMTKALDEAVNTGADSYFIVETSTTASGATVILEALKCN